MVTKWNGRSMNTLWTKQLVTASLVRSNWIQMQFHDHLKFVSFDVNLMDSIFSKPHWNERERERKREEIKVIEWGKQLKLMWMLEVRGREYILWACTTGGCDVWWFQAMNKSSINEWTADFQECFSNQMFKCSNVSNDGFQLVLNDILMMRLNDQMIRFVCNLSYLIRNHQVCFYFISLFNSKSLIWKDMSNN